MPYKEGHPSGIFCLILWFFNYSRYNKWVWHSTWFI